MTLKVYVAGPLFTPYHRAFHARNAKRLRDEGFVCYVPHEQSIAMAIEWDTGTATTPIGIFDMDYDLVAQSDVIVALLDDPDISSGLTCEFGIFWSMMQRDPSKKGVLGLLTDERGGWRNAVGVPAVNAFSLGCLLDMGCVYSNIDDIITHLHGWREGRTDLPKGEIFI